MLMVAVAAILSLGVGKPLWDRAQREKPVRDAWNGPVSLRVTSGDDLGSVLGRFKAATAHHRLQRGLRVFVDIGALHEAGRTLASPLGTEIDAKGMPARDILASVLKPLGSACKLQEGKVMVTSVGSLGESIDYGPNHGEVFCKHGQRLAILEPFDLH
jgi:hypothetical protein